MVTIMDTKKKWKSEAAEEEAPNSTSKSKPTLLTPFAAVITAFLAGSLISFGISSLTNANGPVVKSLDCQSEKDVVDKQRRDLQEHLRELQAQVEEQGGHFEALGSCRNEHSQAKDKLQKATSEHAILQEELKKHTQVKTDLQTQYDAAQKKNLEVRQQLEQCGSQAQIIKNELKRLQSEHEKTKADFVATEKTKQKGGATSSGPSPIVLAQSGFELLKARCGSGLSEKCTSAKAIATMTWATVKMKEAVQKVPPSDPNVIELIERVLGDCIHVSGAMSRGVVLDADNFKVLYTNSVDLFDYVFSMAQDGSKAIAPLIGNFCKNAECS